ncbi:Hypothetical protein A7982_00746 [Minicystis rosea]|nr:Hypothetical protein A7982_00746 [Minicystis rosea]
MRFAPLLVLLLAVAGCTVRRDPPAGSGQHPEGWIDPESARFHARWLRANGDDLGAVRRVTGTTMPVARSGSDARRGAVTSAA